MNKLKVMRQNGEPIGYSFGYLGHNGHVVTVSVTHNEMGVVIRHRQYGDEVAIPDVWPPSAADMLGRALQRAARLV